jgi:hypothetical protein
MRVSLGLRFLGDDPKQGVFFRVIPVPFQERPDGIPEKSGGEK